MAERALVSLPLPQLRAQLQEARYRQPGRAGGPRAAGPCWELQRPGRGWERRRPLTGWVRQGWAGLGLPAAPALGTIPRWWSGWDVGAAPLRSGSGTSCPLSWPRPWEDSLAQAQAAALGPGRTGSGCGPVS